MVPLTLYTFFPMMRSCRGERKGGGRHGGCRVRVGMVVVGGWACRHERAPTTFYTPLQQAVPVQVPALAPLREPLPPFPPPPTAPRPPALPRCGGPCARGAPHHVLRHVPLPLCVFQALHVAQFEDVDVWQLPSCGEAGPAGNGCRQAGGWTTHPPNAGRTCLPWPCSIDGELPSSPQHPAPRLGREPCRPRVMGATPPAPCSPVNDAGRAPVVPGARTCSLCPMVGQVRLPLSNQNC